MIYIFTGGIRTGKTTALLKWFSQNNDADGLLCPDNSHGKRYFIKIKSKDTFLLEAEHDNESIISVGPFKFLESAFKNANNFLMTVACESYNRYVVIDELGKLELQKKGLHPAANVLIPKLMYSNTQHLILIIRDTLLEVMIRHYNIKEYTIVTKASLTKESFA